MFPMVPSEPIIKHNNPEQKERDWIFLTDFNLKGKSNAVQLTLKLVRKKLFVETTMGRYFHGLNQLQTIDVFIRYTGEQTRIVFEF